MAQSANKNFHFFSARMDHTIAGIRASEVADPYALRQGVVPSLVVGPQLKTKNDKPVRWARIIPPGVNDLPRFEADRNTNGHKIVSGSIHQEKEGDKERSFLVAYRDGEGAYYVLARTGLVVRNGSTMNDRLEIQKDGKLVSHGSYSFDHASIRIAAAENESTVDAALKDPNAGFGRVAAERLKTKALGKQIPLIGCPETSYVLWKMPIGAVLLIRDVNGKLVRLVAERTQLRYADATGHNGYFEDLQETFRLMQQKKRAEREAAKKVTAVSETALGEALAPLVNKV